MGRNHLFCLLSSRCWKSESLTSIRRADTDPTYSSIQMSFVTDGYLYLDVDGSDPVIGVPCLSLVTICLLIQCCTLAARCRQLRDTPVVDTKFNVMFVLSCVCSITATMSLMVEIVMILISYWDVIAWTVTLRINSTACLYFSACLVTILVMRLHAVFGHTEYAM